ncbi:MULTISPECIES: hypothetical protein [unclassified Nocardia]|uniref:hypothetical protein n=1 Tax=unclassified Nocardia TaxID=2637762 RepID=UPI00339E7B99
MDTLTPMGDRPFERIDLGAVLPGLSAEEAARIGRAASRIDEIQSPLRRSGWDWFPDNVRADPPPDRVQLVIFGTGIVNDAPGDWLEYELSVVREEQPRMSVEVLIGVACWCEREHGTHYVRSQAWLVGTAASFTEAFESAAGVLLSWMDGNRSPSEARAAAGLPNGPGLP